MKYIFLGVAFLLLGCNGCRDKQKAGEVNYEQVQKDLIASNRAKLKEEDERIKKFIEKKKWNTQQTGTGLYYEIYEKGTGAKAKENDIAVVAFQVSLLDGTVCYTASETNPARFRIGQDNVETGLHEAVQLMSVGDKAHIVLPSHRAFGFTGDQEKIPQDAAVVYDLHLINIE
jgi:FKBP-type peptidyl-prolyl cis-trans isomerase FkpA